jgi:site-specific DNA-methyltransferase (adenine-specific)
MPDAGSAFADDFVTIHHGDCLEVMRGMDANSVDAIVTDPPAGISFMGREWDSDKGGRSAWIAWMAEIAAEALRVAKPGTHALVWALPRTSHWTATAWEDSGWEVRDRIGHIFGTGFPKSLDVSKAIDKAAGVERAVVGRYESPDGRERTASSGPGLPTDGSLGEWHTPITAPTTEAAERWQGWGTALKPAVEDWWLLRKPLGSTVAACVLKHGTGALNIDGCRVETADAWDAFEHPNSKDGVTWAGEMNTSSSSSSHPLGRWPANIVHDGSDEVLAVFPQTSSGKMQSTHTDAERTVFGANADGGYTTMETYGDAGSAARFFYCAKATTAERDDGMWDAPTVSPAEMTGRVEGSVGLSNPRASSTSPRKNIHPTVKPVALMRWLVRLITPPDGIVLDPFMGSGTTLIAARAEGHKSIGIDLESAHCEIARGRMSQGVLL